MKKGDIVTYKKDVEISGSLDTRKTYRRYYDKELEKVKELMPKESPFNSYDITRGKSRGNIRKFWKFRRNIRHDDSGEISTETVVGKFKGIIQVQSVSEIESYNSEKHELINVLKSKLMILSQKDGKPLEIESELQKKLLTDEGRRLFEDQLEELGIAHLDIVKHIGNLYSEDILKKLLLSS